MASPGGCSVDPLSTPKLTLRPRSLRCASTRPERLLQSPSRRWLMDVLVALAISIGILIAGWTYVALGVAALPVWAGIVSWGCFFAAGGKTTGLTKTIAANLSGVFWAFIALECSRRFGGGLPVLSILV